MRNETEGEKVIRAARDGAQRLAGELNTMAWRMRGIRETMDNPRYCRRDWQQDMAELSSYLNTIERYCTNGAEEVVTVYRLAIMPLQKLAKEARENDY